MSNYWFQELRSKQREVRHESDEPTPFGFGPPEGSLCVVLDVDALQGEQASESLEGLLADESVELLRYSDNGPPSTYVAIPEHAAAAIREAADELGGRHEWGLRELGPDTLIADPALLVDKTIKSSVGLLNEIMSLIPVQQLEGADLKPEDAFPPDEPFPSVWDRRVGAFVVAQLGLAAAGREDR